MTKELTPKQEAFCMAYIETGNATKAYKMAYDAEEMKDQTVWKEASQLINNPHVTPRIKELQSQYAELNKVTVESLTRELEAAQELAKEKERPHDMIAATMSKAKLHGLYMKQLEVSGNSDKPLIPKASKKDLARAIAAILSKGDKKI